MKASQSKHRSIIIAVSIIIVLLIIIAAVVSAIVITVIQGTSSKSGSSLVYYNGSFRVLNLNYTEDYKRSSSLEFQSMAVQIEGFIHSIFNYSELRSEYKKVQVVSLSPGSVIPGFVVTLNFDSLTSKNVSVQKIFSENMRNTSTFQVLHILVLQHRAVIKPYSSQAIHILVLQHRALEACTKRNLDLLFLDF
ncbi:hypothetical protein AB205_0135090 [Aquarana catesbeiana]|uniref:SEA domain-containing protein n=1 Tax=Aquarana catesbeiana TaxID=8400 RepID=A0A2G9SJG3_AQUCT|nr:hypothetical protein AB205_0135090 [Aquarana catesbeiana]